MSNSNTGAHPLRAPGDALDALHGLVAVALADEIKRARSNNRSINSSLLSVAMSFLKLCGVTRPDASEAKLDELRGLMPDFTDDEFTTTPENNPS